MLRACAPACAMPASRSMKWTEGRWFPQKMPWESPSCSSLSIPFERKKSMNALIRLFTLCILSLALAAGALAQAYPSRTVRIIVPYPPGGGVDGMARPLADQLSKRWGQPVIVENKAGAATIIGAEFVARSAPDGYTLLLTSESTITSNPHVYSKLPYDPIKELAPITQLIGLPQMVVAHPSVSANSLGDLVALAKTNPGKLNYGSYGSGSQPHLLYEGLKAKAGINLTHVPYKGIAPAVQAVLGGEGK